MLSTYTWNLGDRDKGKAALRVVNVALRQKTCLAYVGSWIRALVP